jgi:TatD DNase family protein
MRKPLVVHCVKALDLLLRLRRELRPAMPWMLHGFRGKPRQMESLLEAGCYVSFGLHHNEESLRLCPLQRLMLETDDAFRPSTETEGSDVPLIAELYNKVAAARGIEMRDLCDEMAENYRNFFRKEPFLT